MFTTDVLITVAALIVFAALLYGLRVLKSKTHLSFTLRTAIALVVGIAYGIGVQALFGRPADGGIAGDISSWIGIIGTGFTRALQFLIVPLVLVSVISAIAKNDGSKSAGKQSGRIVTILLVTTAVSAVISIVVTGVFGLSADKLIAFTESTRTPASIPAAILNVIPTNILGALSANSALPVVFLAMVFGFAYLSVKKYKPEAAANFLVAVDTAHVFIMRIVRYVIAFTPYGVLAIIANRVAASSGAAIVQLGLFVGASFVAMIIVFILHLALAAYAGISPVRYLKKTGNALIFAFSSRSSAATLPLTIDSLKNLGVSEANSNLSAALGTTIGQNGCAGVYPTMVAILVGLVQGWNVWSPGFLISLIIAVVIASIGTAGVGGGATNVSLVVLSLLGLPIELVTVLVSVDFIIDMGRTALNVNDSIIAGVLAGKKEGTNDRTILLSDDYSTEQAAAL